jgi:hypothetical protein
MKLNACKENCEEGSVLAVTVITSALLLIGIGGYLLLVQTQHRSVSRSQAWNAAMTMAESGVEEVLAHLNPGALDTTLQVDRTADGWGPPSAAGFYGPVSRVVTDTGSYSVVFSDATFPTIYATGYVTVPSMSVTLTRTVAVLTTNLPLYNVAFAARTNIDLNGNGPSANSFNSADPNLSYLGRYTNAPGKTSTNGDVAVLYGTLDLGNHNILGDIYLGPNASLNKGTNQVSGSIYDDYNYDYPDVVPPNTSGWIQLNSPSLLGTLIGGLLPAPDGNSYTYVFRNDGDYVVPNLSGSIYVCTNVHVRLFVQGGSADRILVAGNGATNVTSKLTLYVDSPSFSLGSGGSIDGGRAANFAYFGLPNNKSITLSGNANFTGTIYAPDADLTLSGGGSNDYDIVGSVVAKSIKINGHFSFHYDEDLRTKGYRGYTATHWSEI